MEVKDLFNLSDEAMTLLASKAIEIENENEAKETATVVSYGCVCCGGGWCTTGIAGD